MSQRKGRLRTTEATVRVGTIMAIPRELIRFGVQPETVLTQLGLTLDLFDDPGKQIGYAERGRLLELSADITDCPHFGLLLGQKIDIQSLGLIGLLAKSSPDIASALQILTNLFFLQARGAIVDLESDTDGAVLSYRSYEPNVAGTQQTGDGALAGLFNFLRELCGPGWLPTEVRFAHRKPQDTKPYKDFFRTRLRFNAEQYALVFDADWLSRTVPSADPHLHKVLQHETRELTADFQGDFPEQVRQLLRHSILAGHL